MLLNYLKQYEKGSNMDIDILPAGAGDCYFINYSYEGMGHNIWVDGGYASTYRDIKKKINEIKGRNEIIDLLVITHVDADHIRGVLKFFCDETMDHTIVKRVLFNCAATLSNFFENTIIRENETPIEHSDRTCSFSEGITLEQILRNLNLLEERPILAGDIVEILGASLHILSPNNESLLKLNQNWEIELPYEERVCGVGNDYHMPFENLQNNVFRPDIKPTNRASIAFILEQDSKKVLMLADSNPNDIANSLHKMNYRDHYRLLVDATKLSHHGSCQNTSDELLKLIECNTYFISSNRSDCPAKETLARIVKANKSPKFICNYDKKDILLSNEEDTCTISMKRKVRL